MKVVIKVTVTVLLVLGFMHVQPVLGQVGEARRNIAIGINGGIYLNTIGFDPTIKQKQHFGSTFGLTARFTSEKYFSTFCSLQLELNYTEAGWKEDVLDSQSNPLPDTYSREIRYLQFPVLARLAWGREYRGAMGYFIAGPQVGYYIGERTLQGSVTQDSDGNPDRPSGMFAQYSMSVERKFDYGITAGAGFELNTRVGHFLLEGRYYYGLSDIFKNSKKDVFGRSNNNAIVAKVTYLIDIRK